MGNRLERFLLEEKIKYLEILEKSNQDSKYVIYMSNSIDYYNVVQLYHTIKHFSNIKKIKLVIDSSGGDPDAAYKIVKLLRQYCEELVCVVPFMAKSAATLIALGTNEIEMGTISELGPIDPQVRFPKSGWGPVQAVRDTIDFLLDKIEDTNKKYSRETMFTVLMPMIEKMDPIMLGQLERSVKAAKQYAKSLLSEGMLSSKPELVETIVNKLSEGYFSHGYVIDQKEAIEMGLNIKAVNGDYWDNVWSLFYCYHFERIHSNREEFWNKIETLESLREKLNEIEQDIEGENYKTEGAASPLSEDGEVI